MRERKLGKWLWFGGLSALAVVFTLLVKFFDVKAIGPNGSSVGFAGINQFFAEKVGVNWWLYKATDLFWVLIVFIVLFYALLGAFQLFKRKSLKKVDPKILVLGGFYIIMVIAYVLFEKLKINYRPVLIDGILEVSYPSSHTLVAIFVCGSALMINRRLFSGNKAAKIMNCAVVIIMIAMVLGRILSGAHWLTDIIGGALIAGALLAGFSVALEKIGANSKKIEK